MAKSRFAQAVDEIQRALRPFLKERGFGCRGRTFNRLTEDGLTQVVNIQMGRSDPPGTTYHPGIRENLHGLFTINLGVYVPEVARQYGGGEAGSWVQDYHCCIRARLGEVCGADADIWWHARFDETVVDDVWRRLDTDGIPFLERFSTRERILVELSGRGEIQTAGSSPARIVRAIILTQRGDLNGAGELLAQQLLEAGNSPHADYVRRLAAQLNLGKLDA